MINTKNINVLYVDDEEFNLSSFHALFRRDYNIFTAISAIEAFEILEENSIAVILSDQRMPGMTGVEFFEELLEKHPDPVRILVTAYTDVEAVIDAINKGKVYRYLKKPWDDQEMKVAINNAYNYFSTKNELKRKNDELNRFVYSASHDLRSPIMSISGIIKLAKLENDPGKFKEYIDMINSSVERMDRFTHNIIEYYQNERSDDRVEEINIKSLIDEITSPFKSDFPKTSFKITINQKEPFVNDAFRVKIILENIISNAVNFSKTDSQSNNVDIEIKVENNFTYIKVEDSGIGMNDEQLEKMFEMFFKSSHPNTGSGIGLFITKEALEKLKGTSEVSSIIDFGTTFNIKIPNLYGS